MNDVSGVSGDRLRSFIERIETLEEAVTDLNADKSEVYKKAKGTGFDVKAMKRVIAQRRKSPDVRDEEDILFDVYWRAINQTGTPVATRVRTDEAA